MLAVGCDTAGEALLPPVGVVPPAADEVVEMEDDDDNCVGLEDGLDVGSVERKLLEGTLSEGRLFVKDAADDSPPPQESGRSASFLRSPLLSEQKAFIECSLGITSRRFFKQQSPAFIGL